MTRRITSVAAVATLAWFLTDAAARGWSKSSTDFPNYYTAALLARTRQPLGPYYDWTWFQRQMSFAGFGQQLGGYIPQTPLTMAPFLPLSFLPPLTARRVWFVLNCAFLGLACWLISRISQLMLAEVWLLAFLGSFTLRTNFQLGQYYVFLLMVLCAAVWCLERRHELTGGVALGAAVALKLYGAPLLVFAVIRRRWRAAGGILLALLVALGVTVSVFGWHDVLYYASAILPRTLRGETLNPYHPSNGTAATLLRRLFLYEAELNPYPWIDSQAAFSFLWAMFTLSAILLPAVAAHGVSGAPSKRTLAWWLLGMLLVSPNTASYTFALLILPVALLLDSLPRRHWPWILTAYFLLTLPMRPAWSWAFPKVWLLLALFLIAGYPELKRTPVRVAAITLGGIFIVSAAVTGAEVQTSRGEPWRHFPHAVVEPGAIYSASPHASRAGLLYVSIRDGKYVLRRAGRVLSFEVEAFHPTAPDEGSLIYFELVSGQRSQIVRVDNETRQTDTVNTGLRDPREPVVSHNGRILAVTSGDGLFLFDGRSARRLPVSGSDASFMPGDAEIVYAENGDGGSIDVIDLISMKVRTILSDSSELASPSVSPDGRQLVFAARRHGNMEIRVRDFPSRRETTLTGGNCNNYAPVWSGSNEIVFASDCRRGLGLPALYRARVDGIFK